MGVVGDSYFAATQHIAGDAACGDSDGKHYTQILAKSLGYDYVTLARGGCSNTAIRLQADQMIRQDVDFLIYGTTTCDRVEIPQTAEYVAEQGVFNIKYDHCPDISSLDPGFGANTIRSETLVNVLDFPGEYDTGPRQFQAIRDYFELLYIDDLRKQQDAWIVSSGIQAAQHAGIPFMLVMAHDYEQVTDCLRNPDPRYVTSDKPECLELLPQEYDRGAASMRRWHTSDESQQILAEKTLKYVLEHRLLELGA